MNTSASPAMPAANKMSAEPLPAGENRRRQHSPGLDLTAARHDGVQEFHLTVRPLPGEKPVDTGARLGEALRDGDAAIGRQEVFGSLSACEEVLRGLRRVLGEVSWPVVALEGSSCGSGPLAGMHVLAVGGAKVDTITQDGRPIGRSFSDTYARHLLLGDVRPTDGALSKSAQARQAYENLEASLRAGGMGMPNLARTWLFLNDILTWYGPFNGVRTDFYRQHGVFDRMVPASTGVSGRNLFGGALVAAAWAAEPRQAGFTMREVASPRQCPAPCYGSSFSRAVELLTPGLQRLLISGTASIEPGGASVGGDDIEAQIDLTMEVVRAILVSRELEFQDVSRATAYLKRPTDARFFDLWRRRNGLEAWPVVCTVADICRDELLFEIELDALGVPGSAA